MTERYRDDLAEAIVGRQDEPLRMRTGEVTVVHSGTVTVTIGGGTTPVPQVPHLNHYSPHVGDIVLILQQGAALVVVGELA